MNLRPSHLNRPTIKHSSIDDCLDGKLLRKLKEEREIEEHHQKLIDEADESVLLTVKIFSIITTLFCIGMVIYGFINRV